MVQSTANKQLYKIVASLKGVIDPQSGLPKQRYYPQCRNCSNKQAAAVRSNKRTLVLHWRGPMKPVFSGSFHFTTKLPFVSTLEMRCHRCDTDFLKDLLTFYHSPCDGLSWNKFAWGLGPMLKIPGISLILPQLLCQKCV